MPRRKKSKSKPRKLKPRVQKQLPQKPEDLAAYIREADEVKQLTQMAGWGILERDLIEFRNGFIAKLAYLDPSRVEHKEARVMFIAIDKLLNLVNDYQDNRVRAIELLQKMENPDMAVTLDVDNE